MQRYSHLAFLAITMIFFGSCLSDNDELQQEDTTAQISPEVIERLQEMGFNPDGIEIYEDGYRIERDIIIRPEDLIEHDHSAHTGKGRTEKQYSTINLVTTGGSRNISIFMPVAEESTGGRGNKPKGSSGFNSNYNDALNLAISRFNAEGLELTFSRANSQSAADIVFTRLGKRDERRGILGSAGFPTVQGDPYDEVRMSGIIDTQYGWSTEAIATVMAHELGHCIGFRHTDYFDRSLSCGGQPSNEGPSTVGANHIPGTPTGFSAESWMLACSGGGDRPFNNDDKVALDYLY